MCILYTNTEERMRIIYWLFDLLEKISPFNFPFPVPYTYRKNYFYLGW